MSPPIITAESHHIVVAPPPKVRVFDPRLPEEAITRFYDAVERMVTEDDESVESPYQELQAGLLTETLRGSWNPCQATGEPRGFVVMSDVGLFVFPDQNPVVPDVLLSMDVSYFHPLAPDKAGRAYLLWEYKKRPEIAIEIVSNKKGEEDGRKFVSYAEAGVRFYVIFDPFRYLSQEILRIYELRYDAYEPYLKDFFPQVGLGLRLWNGDYGGLDSMRWLRWYDATGALVPHHAEQTERAEREAERAEREAARAEREAARAEREAERAELAEQKALREAERAALLAAKLRELGIDPNQF